MHAWSDSGPIKISSSASVASRLVADLRSSQARNWARREKVILGGNWASLFQFVNSFKAFHYLGKNDDTIRLNFFSNWKISSPQMFSLFPTEQIFLGPEAFYRYRKYILANKWLHLHDVGLPKPNLTFSHLNVFGYDFVYYRHWSRLCPQLTLSSGHNGRRFEF